MPADHLRTAGDAAAAEWIMVVGLPASGRHTLAANLADRLSAQVFDLRTYARHHPGAPAPVPNGLDPRGEYDDLTVEYLLRDALLGGGFPTPGRPMLLPAFPETAAQLLLLHTVAEIRDVRTRALELDAVNVVLAARALHRRPCRSCTDDTAGAPHQDASPRPEMATHCPTCGHRLTERCSDAMTTFIDRVSRYRDHRPALYQAAKRSSVPWQHLDTTRVTSVSAVADEAVRLLGTPRDVALAYPDRGPADGIPAPRLPPEDGP